jgi:4-amino-4-deoxy-L-arabinose transferase-like glycosyltransferase
MTAARDVAGAFGRLFSRLNSEHAPVRDAVVLLVLGAVLRFGVVIWAAARFPPADDGTFYHIVASRIAQGLGYTWLWPDGAITYAAHYPVGYPALLGAAYALFGAVPVVAMVLNAALGSLAVLAVHRVAAAVSSRLGAIVAGAAVALHPGLVFYTPALMTEGVTAALFALLLWMPFLKTRWPAWRLILVCGLLAGLTTLIRPQAVLLAPVVGLFLLKKPWLGAVLVTALSLLVVLPWTVRNCARMERCVFVSANGGWNLFIGAAEKSNGSFVQI